MKKHKTLYRRNLPHIQPKDGVYAITIRLSGSLPKFRIETLRDNRDLKIAEIDKLDISEYEKGKLIIKVRNVYFGKFDELLDNESIGPQYLKQNNIAKEVMNSLHFMDGRDFKLVCYCIMSNHIHLVLYKCNRQLFEILGNFKSYTGLKCNNLIYGLPKKGDKRPDFWQHESYDHLIRNRQDFNYQVRYVMNNPVKASLSKHWQDWKFAFIREEFSNIMNSEL